MQQERQLASARAALEAPSELSSSPERSGPAPQRALALNPCALLFTDYVWVS